MIKRILNSAIFNSWFNSAITLFSSLIAIPIVISKLSVEEINVWFLFGTITVLSRTVLFGFGVTFQRFITYSFSGIKIQDFKEIKGRKVFKKGQLDPEELSKVYYLMRRVYLVISLVYVALLLIGGTLSIKGPVLSLAHPIDGWVSYVFVFVSSTVSLFLSFYQVFLQGTHKVSLVQRTLGIVNFLGLFFILFVLFVSPTLILIVGVYQSIALISAIVIAKMSNDQKLKLGVEKGQLDTDKELFSVVWDSAWKSGTTSVMANIVKHVSGIIVAQWFSASASASYLFTKRIFDVLERFTATTFQARVPVLASLRGSGNMPNFLKKLKESQYITFSIFLLGYIVFAFFGEPVLGLIGSNVQLGSKELIIFFSFASFIGRWGSINLVVSNLANHVVEHLNATIYLVTFLTFVYFFNEPLGLLVFPIGQIVGIPFSIWLFIRNVYPSMDKSIFEYEKTGAIPFFIILVVINYIYYFI
jgi:hypothetical protein